MSGIIKLQAENVKRLHAIEIVPDGSVITIGGKNGAGKSSVLDSIMMALGGGRNIPGKPIRNGEDSATIKVEIDGYIITRTITEKGAYLKVTNEDGAKLASGQSFLDGFIGQLSFDPLAFSRMAPKDQAATLRDILGIDTTELDEQHDEAFTTRRDLNRDLKAVQSRMADRDVDIDLATDEISVSALIEQLESARQINNDREMADKKIDSVVMQIRECEERLAKLNSAHDSISAQYAQMPAAVDTAPIQDQIRGAEEKNIEIRENNALREMDQRRIELYQKINDQNEIIEAVAEKKSAMLQAADFPIDGLTLDDDGVVFNGIPFDQASSAEQIRVSVAIGLAMNPKLPIILIKDGSLLDQDARVMVHEMAEAAGAQIWMECVGEGDDCSFIIEDGSIKDSE